jgi:hypothetical protein
MRKAILGTSALLLALCLGAGDAPKGDTPQVHSFSARTALEKRDGVVRRAYQDYLSKITAADKQLIAALDQSLREAMNNKDLNEATAINAVKKQAEDRLVTAQKGNVLPRLAGTRWKWAETAAILTFNADGTFVCTNWSGFGHWELVSDNTVMAVQPDTQHIQITFTSDFQHSLWVETSPKHNIAYATRVSQ